ncbi:hypothetical protein DIPPA_16777 [Diplonema papillatum]|nr:hypothetical protein DIPPA_16777 [Diplonema papillatum]KAJ9455804.1 hypothetical protein DIPPA_16777 [Diplonema papillatum]
MIRRGLARRWASVVERGESGAFLEDFSKVDLATMRVDVTPRNDALQALCDEQRKYFVENSPPEYFDDHGISDPKTLKEWVAKKFLDFDLMRSRAKSRNYGTRIGITTLNHVSNPDWAVLFGIKEMYLEVTMWLWAIHMWMVQKRMWVVPESSQINKAMHKLFSSTMNSRITDLYETGAERRRAAERIEKLFTGNLAGLDESFHASCQYRDAVLLYALYRNSPFEHREEIPMFAWYTLVQYIRLHLAVFDRIPNNEFKQGLFYFYHPLDDALFDKPSHLDSPAYVVDLMLGRKGLTSPKAQRA